MGKKSKNAQAIAKTMPAPYSYDLRKKAIEAVKRGHQKINVCRLFKISRNTLDFKKSLCR
jgi:hypothetical protein